jgi:hypothetical protein
MCVAPQPGYTGTSLLMEPLVRDLITGRELGILSAAPSPLTRFRNAFYLYPPSLKK